jgi:hypothetical protein
MQQQALQRQEELNLFQQALHGHQLPFLLNLSLHVSNQLLAAWCWNNCD